MRLAGSQPPQLIADENHYGGGNIVTDGERLYWMDRRLDQILSLGRAAGALPGPHVLVAKRVSSKRRGHLTAWPEKIPIFAVIDFPPPEGTPWSADHLINNGCPQAPVELPRCAAKATGVSWAKLASKAADLHEQPVSVRDSLVVGPPADSSGVNIACLSSNMNPRAPGLGEQGGRQLPGTSALGCFRDRRHIALGPGPAPLRTWSPSEDFVCLGDESRLCCRSPAFGQTVIATGVLIGSAERGWGLNDVTLCEVRPH